MIKNFLKNLKELGWTQVEIAKKTGITQGMISNLEHGRACKLETAIKIADAFNVTLDEVANRSVTGKDKKQREMDNPTFNAGSGKLLRTRRKRSLQMQ